MFDDNTNNNSNQTPSNLPIAEPDDNFGSNLVDTPEFQPTNDMVENEFKPVNSALDVGVLKPKVDDMFGGVDTQTVPDLSSPVAPMNNANNVVGNISSQGPVVNNPSGYDTILPPPGMSDSNNQNNLQMTEPVGNKKVIIWIVVLVVIVVLGSGSAWIYFSFIRNANTNINDFNQQPVFDNNSVIETENNNVVIPEVVEDNTTSTVDPSQQVIVGEPLDTDGDGLDDVREVDIGTDPLNWDTDADSLSDADEVTIWKTNPLNADTDGDGYKDGEEIKNGYSPTGPGKLFEIPMTTTTDNNNLNTATSTTNTAQ